VKPPFKVSLGSSGFEQQTQENLIWKQFNTDCSLSSIEIELKMRENLKLRNIKLRFHCIDTSLGFGM
jgi:hypothetical protein